MKNIYICKKYRYEGQNPGIVEIRRVEIESTRRTPRDQSGGNLPYIVRTQQTRIRIATEDSQEVSADRPRLVVTRCPPNVSDNTRTTIRRSENG